MWLCISLSNNLPCLLSVFFLFSCLCLQITPLLVTFLDIADTVAATLSSTTKDRCGSWDLGITCGEDWALIEQTLSLSSRSGTIYRLCAFLCFSFPPVALSYLLSPFCGFLLPPPYICIGCSFPRTASLPKQQNPEAALCSPRSFSQILLKLQCLCPNPFHLPALQLDYHWLLIILIVYIFAIGKVNKSSLMEWMNKPIYSDHNLERFLPLSFTGKETRYQRAY